MTLHERAIRHWRITFLLWAVLLTVATHLPQPPPSGETFIESPDKLLHFVCFGMLGFLWMCGSWVKNAFYSWSIVAIWAFVDEFTQDILPLNRPFSVEDLIAGELGILAAYCWWDSMARPSVQELKQKLDCVFASSRNWIILGTSSLVSTVVLTVGIWIFFYVTFDSKQSDGSFFIGFNCSVLLTLFVVLKLGKIQLRLRQQTFTMVWSLLGSIGLASMVGFALHFLGYTAWVPVLFVFVLYNRFVWNRAT